MKQNNMNMLVKCVRMELRQPQSEFASLLGVSTPAVSRMETGRQQVSQDVIEMIEHITYCSVDKLLADYGLV